MRGETKTAYFFGNDSSELDKYAVHGSNSGFRTHEVTTGLENPNKLHGITGNVYEWVADAYKPKLEGGKDPLNIKSECDLTEECRVFRGGSWNSYYTGYLRSATRDSRNTGVSSPKLGFRLVRTQ